MRNYFSAVLVSAMVSAAACGGAGHSPTEPSVEGGGTLTSIGSAGTSGKPKPAPTPTPAPAPPAGAAPTPGAAPVAAEAEFTGTISALSGAAAGFQFTAAGRVVKADSTTAIIGDSNTVMAFADLKNGGVVEVHGVQHDGFVQATRIHVEGPEPEVKPEPEPEPEPEAEHDGNGGEARLEGSLGAVVGAWPGVSSSVAGAPFVTSSSTRFDGAACTAFRSGDRVEVRGTKRSDGL